MGRATKHKHLRREARRELERQTRTPEHHRAIENLVSELRVECYYVVARLVDDALRDLYGFGDKRIARVWEYVKTRAIWDGYFDQGLPLEEIDPTRRAQGA